MEHGNDGVVLQHYRFTLRKHSSCSIVVREEMRFDYCHDRKAIGEKLSNEIKLQILKLRRNKCRSKKSNNREQCEEWERPRLVLAPILLSWGHLEDKNLALWAAFFGGVCDSLPPYYWYWYPERTEKTLTSDRQADRNGTVILRELRAKTKPMHKLLESALPASIMWKKSCENPDVEKTPIRFFHRTTIKHLSRFFFLLVFGTL